MANMSAAQASNKEPWHLDKRVPVAMIVTLIVQTIAVVWWAASMDSRVQNHERRLSSLETTDQRFEVEARRLAELLARVDERLLAQTQILHRLEAQLIRANNGR